ncbi:hypothetical protein [Micromonospora mirobrigensis]|uniref:Uncharacterized protein n=1 Tax=Micromonospora mirobrigensis TaxID=262898 RepID=A0A1C4WDZ7_9ACTN|nr:hypothetical protein [Micromonospora mirobrigensis]SCE94410.1 hypothetical protein GA0070564_102196 [Micromonospora mirobrigensis]
MSARALRTAGGLAVMAAAAVVAYPMPVPRWLRAWPAATGRARAQRSGNQASTSRMAASQ